MHVKMITFSERSHTGVAYKRECNCRCRIIMSLLVFMLCWGISVADDINLSMIAASAQGFNMGGGIGNYFGVCVRKAGDINKDGYGDIIIGAEYEDGTVGTDAGIVYVIYGRNIATPFDNMQMPNSALAANVGFRIIGAVGNQRLGSWVDAAGDVNGDGTDDVIIGAAGFNDVYVIFGPTYPAVLRLLGTFSCLLQAHLPTSAFTSWVQVERYRSGVQ